MDVFFRIALLHAEEWEIVVEDLREDYNNLLVLAGDMPIALGEVGPMPTPEILPRQPRWSERETVKELFESEETPTLQDPPRMKTAGPRIHHPIFK